MRTLNLAVIHWDRGGRIREAIVDVATDYFIEHHSDCPGIGRVHHVLDHVIWEVLSLGEMRFVYLDKNREFKIWNGDGVLYGDILLVVTP